VIAGTSWPGALVLGTFFVTSSALSRATTPESGLGDRRPRRTATQVFANGGVAVLASVAGLFGRELLALAVLAGSLAAATADTWATEIGRTSSRAPRQLLSRRVVPRGESGGVTRRGLAGSLAGAATIALVAGVAGAWSGVVHGDRVFAFATAIVAGGLAGSIVDSLLGEVAQERRWCAACWERTEARTHRCGTRTRFTSGLHGVTNDVVNAVCVLAGGACAIAGI
jgi:uncharacterized protein (TIGR00297 family)